MHIQLTVNRARRHIDVPAKKRLLDILREDFGLTGTREGCGQGECGACTVLMNGRRVNSCLVPAFQLVNARITTIEGLRKWTVFPYLEHSYLEHGAVQCGFCMTGFAMSTVALLMEAQEALSVDGIKSGLSGNLCRCTGYTKIIEAVRDLCQQQESLQMLERDWRHEFTD